MSFFLSPLWYGQIKRKDLQEFGPEACDPVQTNYPDSLCRSALKQTLISSESAGAVIKAELNERRGRSSSDTIRPNTSPTHDSGASQAGPAHQPENRMPSAWHRPRFSCAPGGRWAEPVTREGRRSRKMTGWNMRNRIQTNAFPLTKLVRLVFIRGYFKFKGGGCRYCHTAIFEEGICDTHTHTHRPLF